MQIKIQLNDMIEGKKRGSHSIDSSVGQINNFDAEQRGMKTKTIQYPSTNGI